MSAYQRLLALALAVVALIGYWSLALSPPALEPLGDRPKLVVVVVFDQMRGDYLRKWQHLFVEGGFKRLQSEGAWFTNCHYPYAYTLTSPGHTSLLTGTYPAKHGIIANEWFDREEKRDVPSTKPPPNLARDIAGPHRRKSFTVGDMLLGKLKGRSRVASLSIKERSAILMAAFHAQICYWFNLNSGDFTTSPWYRRDEHGRDLPDEMHRWAREFNALRKSDQWVNKDWTRLREESVYLENAGPDDVEGEGFGYFQGRSFPHPTPYVPGTNEAKKHYYEAVDNSPYGNDLLLDFAKTTIEKEKLGQSHSIDLLCLSFSSNDLVGHCWGPDSQEVLDITLRSDLLIKELLDFLDAKVGKGKYVFALSADHGVCPITTAARKQGHTSGRLSNALMDSLAAEHLNKVYPPQAGKSEKRMWFATKEPKNYWVYFNHAQLKELNLQQSDVEKVLADWYTAQPGIKKAYTRTQMLEPEEPGDSEELKMMRRSFHSEASGDVMLVLEPYFLFMPAILTKDPHKVDAFQTTHGSPHPYDTHVPLLVMGPRVNPSERGERIAPQAMAAILAEALRVEPPNHDYPLPPGLFQP